MWLLLLGLVLLAVKWSGWSVGAALPMWAALLPFGLAVLWWSWADSSGWTKRREMDKMDKKRDARRAKNLENLGMGPDRKRKR